MPGNNVNLVNSTSLTTAQVLVGMVIVISGMTGGVVFMRDVANDLSGIKDDKIPALVRDVNELQVEYKVISTRVTTLQTQENKSITNLDSRLTDLEDAFVRFQHETRRTRE